MLATTFSYRQAEIMHSEVKQEHTTLFLKSSKSYKMLRGSPFLLRKDSLRFAFTSDLSGTFTHMQITFGEKRKYNNITMKSERAQQAGRHGQMKIILKLHPVSF